MLTIENKVTTVNIHVLSPIPSRLIGYSTVSHIGRQKFVCYWNLEERTQSLRSPIVLCLWSIVLLVEGG